MKIVINEFDVFSQNYMAFEIIRIKHFQDNYYWTRQSVILL